MNKTTNIFRLVCIGIVLQSIVLGIAFTQFEALNEVSRHAARWSGRLSLLIFVIAFFNFGINYGKESLAQVKGILFMFCVMHFIHLGFVFANVSMNAISLVPFKLVGGALAYAMILFYPFVFDRIQNKSALHWIYFYYVGAVMAITIVARMRGDFEGAEPSVFHYTGLCAIALVFLFGIRTIIRRKQSVR